MVRKRIERIETVRLGPCSPQQLTGASSAQAEGVVAPVVSLGEPIGGLQQFLSATRTVSLGEVAEETGSKAGDGCARLKDVTSPVEQYQTGDRLGVCCMLKGFAWKDLVCMLCQ